MDDIRNMGQVGSQLSTTFKVFDNAIVNPDALKIMDYERMLDTDETVAQGFDFLTLGVLVKLGEYDHENPKIKDFINEQFERMKGSLYLASQEILSAIWAGFSVTEINYALENGKTVLDSLCTYHPFGIYFNVDDKGKLLDMGVKQYLITGSHVDIPTNKCIIYTHNSRFGNLYGKSAFKRVYKDWLLKDPILKMMARALDKFGTPLIVAMVPEGEINDPDKPGEKVQQLDYVLRILDDLQSQEAIAMTNSGENKADVKTLTNGGTGVGEAFISALNYVNKMIYRGLLLPSLIGDEGSKGSYSLGQKHFDTFQSVLDSIYENLTDVLIDQLVRRLIEFNFGTQNNYGKFPQRKLSDENKEILMKIFSDAVDRGILDSDDQADLDYMRTSLDIPPKKIQKTDDEIEVMNNALNDYKRYKAGDSSNE